MVQDPGLKPFGEFLPTSAPSLRRGSRPPKARPQSWPPDISSVPAPGPLLEYFSAPVHRNPGRLVWRIIPTPSSIQSSPHRPQRWCWGGVLWRLWILPSTSSLPSADKIYSKPYCLPCIHYSAYYLYHLATNMYLVLGFSTLLSYTFHWLVYTPCFSAIYGTIKCKDSCSNPQILYPLRRQLSCALNFITANNMNNKNNLLF